MKPKFSPELMPFFGNLIPHHIQFEIFPLFWKVEKRALESLTVFDCSTSARTGASGQRLSSTLRRPS